MAALAGVGPAKTIPDAKNQTQQQKMKNKLPNPVGFHCEMSL